MADENATFGVPRLLLRGARSPGRAGEVTWELFYGGLPIATGSLDLDQEVLFTETAAIEPAMDSSGFTLAAWYGDGLPAEVEATCVRPVRPPTRAEATARAKWPGARHQQEAPEFRRPFVAETRAVSRPGSAGPGGDQGGRCVYVYQHFSVLLAYRRWRLREPPAAARQRAGLDRAG